MKHTVLNAKLNYLEWIGNEKVEILRKIENWPLPFVKEKLIETGHSTKDNVDEHILWYKQFMSFKILRPEIRCGMFSDIIDGVWHQHILFTQDYENFGKEIFGRFIHHIPCNIMDMSDSALKEYGIWITDYEEVYGHLPDDLSNELKEQIGYTNKGPKCVGGDHSGYKCMPH